MNVEKRVDLAIHDFLRYSNTVPHIILMSKLDHYGINDIVKLIGYFLSHWTQQIVKDGCTSSEITPESGVPWRTHSMVCYFFPSYFRAKMNFIIWTGWFQNNYYAIISWNHSAAILKFKMTKMVIFSFTICTNSQLYVILKIRLCPAFGHNTRR